MTSRRYDRTPSTFFTGGEITRLGFGFVMMMILVAAIWKARDPKMWIWFARGDDPVAERDQDEVPPAVPRKNESTEKPAQDPGEQPAEAVKEEPPQDKPTGPTDEDQDEREAAIEELQVVSDKTLGMAPEEMVAYWRFFRWVENQPLPVLKRRARRDLLMNNFMRTPDAHRGQIVRLNLNIVRILSYDAPDNSAGVEKVYELWGWAEESQAWLFCAVTSELPPGMPVGVKVNERAQIYGYFFKLQGYLEAGAKPRAKPLAAPLLIGRVDWKRTPPQQPLQEPLWFTYTVTGGLIILMCFTATRIFRRRKSKRPLSEVPSPEKRSGMSLEQWLNTAGGEESTGPNPNKREGGPDRSENNGHSERT